MVGIALATAVGLSAGGPGVAASAVLGVVVVVANFAAHGLSLAWAAGVSIIAVQVVALGGFVLRLGAIVGLMFLLSSVDWFSPLAFGLAVVPGTLALLAYEAKLMLGGVGSALQIPADPAAMRAAEQRAPREA
jgi:hypothetical protein